MLDANPYITVIRFMANPLNMISRKAPTGSVKGFHKDKRLINDGTHSSGQKMPDVRISGNSRPANTTCVLENKTEKILFSSDWLSLCL